MGKVDRHVRRKRVTEKRIRRGLRIDRQIQVVDTGTDTDWVFCTEKGVEKGQIRTGVDTGIFRQEIYFAENR